MGETARIDTPRRLNPAILLIALASGAFAIAVGLAAGHPTAATLGPPILVVGLAGFVMAFVRPFAAFLVVIASTVFLVVYNLPGNRGLNPVDLLLVPLLIASVLGGARDQAQAADRAVTDPRRLELFAASRRLAVAAMVYYGIAWLSVAGALYAGRMNTVIDATFSLMRILQVLLFFPLGLWWFRSEARIHHAIRAVMVTVVILTVVNAFAVAFLDVKRAGLAWYVNETTDIIGGPNAIGSTMLFLGVLLLVRQTLMPRVTNLALFAIALTLLVLSATRSGLLASLVVTALLLPRARWSWVVVAVLMVGAALPLVPELYWSRITHTITLQRGTFEAYTSLLRFYSWNTAFNVFVAHPILGVGYLGFATVSGDYGSLRLIGGPAENTLLETASGMGILGVIAFLVVLLRLFQLGRVVQRHAPPGSLAAVMARHHAPLLIGYLVVSITGDMFYGMESVGQIAIWCSMLLGAGHLALAKEAPVIGSSATI